MTSEVTTSRARKFAWGAVGMLAGLLAIGLLSVPVVVSQIRSTQVDNTAKSNERDETLAIIKDCTQPKGKCYERGQRQTAAILSSAQQIIILAAACSADLPPESTDARVADISACVAQRLTAAPAKP